jgi:hypothetical protein
VLLLISSSSVVGSGVSVVAVVVLCVCFAVGNSGGRHESQWIDESRLDDNFSSMIRYSYARERSYPRRETTCAAWWSDCGFGIWNNNTCECDCISPYCFDELHQSCVTVRCFFLAFC